MIGLGDGLDLQLAVDLAHGRVERDRDLAAGARTIVDAMRAKRVERYIGMATPQPARPARQRGLLGRIVPFMGRGFLQDIYGRLRRPGA